MKSIRPDEFELSLFGPGYGESALSNLGANEWIVVDSCYNNQSDVTAPLDYLRRIGVDPAKAVRVIVATHWHDDHVRGLSNIVRSCIDANFVCASALTEREFVTMVTRYQAGSGTPVGSGVREMYQVLLHLREAGRQALFAAPNRLIFRSTAASRVAGGACEITTLSPSDKQIEMFWRDIARQMPGIRQTIRRAVANPPNHLTVALWISVGEERILLGSDLEETKDADTGWSVIVRSAERPIGTASVFKVPHHGSTNGHSDEVWDQMVAKGAYALLTPFTRGDVCLPSEADRNRIVARAGSAYITANPQLRAPVQRPAAVARAIRASSATIRLAEPKIGHIRLRKRYGGGHRWYVALMDGAYKI